MDKLYRKALRIACKRMMIGVKHIDLIPCPKKDMIYNCIKNRTEKECLNCWEESLLNSAKETQ